MEQARAHPDYRTWTEVDELTRDVPQDLDALGALGDRLKPIESRWSSLAWSKVIADKVDMARRNQTASGRSEYLKLAGEAASKLRRGICDRVLHTILTRNLPSLAVSRADLLAFGKKEGMVESWEESGLVESSEWRSWTIATAFKQSKPGSQKSAKGSYVRIACDATGAVKSASLSVDLPDDNEYLGHLLALPKGERDLRHAERVRQVLADLPPIVRRFLLVAAPEQADATVQKASALAALTPAQFVGGITGSTMWLGTLAQSEPLQVEFMLLAGGGLCVIVDQPPVRSRLKEIDELTKALGR